MRSRLRIGLEGLGVLALVILGGIQLRGPIDVDTLSDPGTATGVVLKENGQTLEALDMIPLVMTGGLAKYNLAIVDLADYGITGTGVVVTASISWVKAPAGGTSDIAISKCADMATPTASSGTLLPNGNNLSNSTGSLVGLFGTGAVRVNGADCLVVKSLTDPTSSGSGYLIISVAEDPSE